MNILVVSQYYYPEPFRINEICEELVVRGHRVTVLAANPNYPDGEFYDGYQNEECIEEINGVTVIRCKCRPRHKGLINLGINYIDYVIKANKRIMEITGQFDCVYAYQLSPVTSCLPAINYKKKNRIPMLLYCLDIWPESLRGTVLGSSLGLSVIGEISKRIYRSAEKIAVTSPAFINYISNLCNIRKSEIEYLPQHAAEIKVDSTHKNAQETVNFVFMGNIGEAQDLECLIQAISLIQDRSKIRFHIIGSGSHYEICRKLANNLSVEDSIMFYGRHPKSDMPKFYEIADICYVSLKDEGIVGSTIPGKVQEYMSAGKPILACMNGDTTSIIREANCGICVPAGERKELADAIIKMSSDSTDLQLLGENAERYYIDHFTISSHVNQLERMMGELIQ